ncbi:krab-a domain-containing protein, partial [Lasius niger]
MSIAFWKQGLVELCRASGLTDSENAPDIIQCSRISRIKNNFYYKGNLDGGICRFRIDTGSDVSILSEEFVKGPKEHFEIENCCLKYPTGELIKVKYKVNVVIELGKHVVEIPIIVANISDDCILGIDFLKKINLERIFESQFEDLIAGNCGVLEHDIKVTDSKPIKQAPRRVPIYLREEVDRIIKEMKSQGVIEESRSPWVSPVVLVKKKDGSFRFCVDYRKLNSVTVKDSYPLPRIEDILDQLSGNSWFSTLDLKSGYWQVKLSSKDKEKTAFSVGNGLWQFNVMPFGLCNAPATFERLMEKVFQEILSKICLIYLDDIIVFSKTLEEMIENLRKAFLRLRSANLKINPKKCSLFGREVKYFGHVVSEQGITTDPEKISAVRNWPVPQNSDARKATLATRNRGGENDAHKAKTA